MWHDVQWHRRITSVGLARARPKYWMNNYSSGAISCWRPQCPHSEPAVGGGMHQVCVVHIELAHLNLLISPITWMVSAIMMKLAPINLSHDANVQVFSLQCWLICRHIIHVPTQCEQSRVVIMWDYVQKTHVILEGCDTLLQKVSANLVILNHTTDL